MLDVMQLLAENTAPWITPSQLALLGSGLAIIFTVNRWRKLTIQKKARASAQETASTREVSATAPRAAPVLNVRAVSTELAALLGELEETSRRLTAQLDNRYTKLELLIVEADEKIRKLEGLAAHSTGSPQSPQSPKTASIAAAAVSDSERTLQRLRQERGAPAPIDDPAYQPIYALSDSGKSPREIAQQLSRQPGEIELILAPSRAARLLKHVSPAVVEIGLLLLNTDRSRKMEARNHSASIAGGGGNSGRTCVSNSGI